MQRMHTLRAFLSNTAGIRRRPCDACGVASQPQLLLRGVGICDESEGGLGSRSLSSSSRYHKDVPKRIYQGAPKWQHGEHAGMRKWSKPHPSRKRDIDEVTVASVEAKSEGGEVLAFGQSGSTAARVEPREVSTKLKEIRVSPWSLNLVTKLARALPVVEAAAQLKFCKKKHTVTVLKAMQNALNLASMRYGLAAEQMMVKEIFVTKGKVLKSMRIMGRGRTGIARKKWSHLNLTLREIDFDALIEGAETRSHREKLKARKKQVEVLLAARRQEELGEIQSGTVPPPLKLNSK